MKHDVKISIGPDLFAALVAGRAVQFEQSEVIVTVRLFEELKKREIEDAVAAGLELRHSDQPSKYGWTEL
jgi:hypothetical protein